MVPQHDLPALFAWAQANDFALFPIPAWCKRPTGIVGSHMTDWSKDPGQWLQWYEQNGGCNFGVACGPSKLIVVDVDIDGFDKYREWKQQHPEMASHFPIIITTPTGGAHLYFKINNLEINSDQLRQPNLCGKEVNVRAGHGYVVFPWSVTDKSRDPGVKADGSYFIGNYRGPVGSAPQVLIQHCLPNKPDESPIALDENIDLTENGLPKDSVTYASVWGRIRAVLDRLAVAVPGERNEKLNLAAFDIGKIVAEGKLAEWKATELLWSVCDDLGIPRDEEKAKSTIRSGLRAAPRVGRPEPRSAMAALLAAAVPLAPVVPLPPRRPPFTEDDDLIPEEPAVERLIYRGLITVLSGRSGSGKTTFMASLVASSVSDVRDFIVGPGLNGSDVLIHPCCWVFVSYEGGKHIKRNMAAWHIGSGKKPVYRDRAEFVSIDDGPLVCAGERRGAVVNQAQAQTITRALDDMRRRHPGTLIVLVLDNASAGIEDVVDRSQVMTFYLAMKTLARDDTAIVILAHPTKSGSSEVIGSGLWEQLADIGGTIEVLRDEDSEWVQWVSFWKHREAMNGKCLEVRSHRIDRPLVELPASWGSGNERARQRQMHDLHVPFVSSIRVRNKRDKEGIAKGVTMTTEVTGKPEATLRT